MDLLGEEHERTRRHNDTDNPLTQAQRATYFAQHEDGDSKCTPGSKADDVETFRQFMRPFIPLPPADRVPQLETPVILPPPRREFAGPEFCLERSARL